MNKSAQRGFNLIELMVTVTLVGILLGIAIPSMRDFIRNNRLTGGVNDVLHALNVARTEAIKRQNGNVVVCGTATPDVNDNAKRCDYNTFVGWFVFQDLNGNWQHDNGEPVIEQHTTLDASVTVKLDGADAIVAYAPTGFAQPAGARRPTATMVMCDSRGVVQVGNAATARALFITATGRARATAAWTDVHTTALGNVTGGSCP